MACTTPRSRSVHWGETELNEYPRASPYSESASVVSAASDASTASTNATSTLAYVNSQLVAHGFVRAPGVSFEGLSKADSERLSKCILGMLSQRVEDTARAEELSTKLRTLSYEHERLSSMHRTTLGQLASSERDTSHFKSRLAASQKANQASETAHKMTSAELQRARSTLLSVRQTYAAELKRREKETERLLERWQKIADSQTKLGALPAGMKAKSAAATGVASFMNYLPSGASGGEIDAGSNSGDGNASLLEDALEDAETARRELMDENTSLKHVVLSAANELVRMTHSARARAANSAGTIGTDEGTGDEHPPKLAISDVFSIPAPESAQEKFGALMESFREAVWRLRNVEWEAESEVGTGRGAVSSSASGQGSKKGDGERGEGDRKEIQRLQNMVVDLRRQLEQAQVHKQSGAYSDQAQAIIRKFVNEDDDRVSVREREVIEKVRKDLDNARRKIDEAALTLKDEKQVLEEQRQAFQREQHLWRSQMCIPQDPMPQPPTIGLAAYFDEPAEPLALPYSPSRAPFSNRRDKQSKKVKVSPAKKSALASAGTASPRRTGAASGSGLGTIKRSPLKVSATAAVTASLDQATGRSVKKSVHAISPRKLKSKSRTNPALLGASPTRQKVIPPMETEVIMHSFDAYAVEDVDGPVEGGEREGARTGGSNESVTISTTKMATLLSGNMTNTNVNANATSFMIPSTSQQSLIISNSFVLPPPTPMTSLPPPEEDLLSTLKKDKKVAREAREVQFSTAGTTAGAGTSNRAGTGTTKSKTPFPVAKPLAQHMTHAYSPVRPSPLSRILMLSKSPNEDTANARFGARLGADVDVDMDEMSYDAVGDGERTTTPPIAFDSDRDMDGYKNEDEERTVRRVNMTRVLSLEEELGIGGAGVAAGRGAFEDDEDDESEDESSVEDSPLRAKDLRRPASGKMNAARGAGATTRPLFSGGGRGGAAADGKGAGASTLFDTKAKLKTKTGDTKEKEKEKENSGRTGGMNPGARFGVGTGLRAQAGTAKALAGGSGKGGARRVPIGSADAAPVGPGWK